MFLQTWLLPIALLAVATLIAFPLSRYLAWIMDGKFKQLPVLGAIEKRLDTGSQTWVEYLGALLGVSAPVMMLEGGGLRVVPVTCHLSVRAALDALDTATIGRCGRITAAALARDFGIERPRLAVAGLNPHAGEDGAMGDEERTIIAPAIAALAAHGIAVTGPHSADTLFHQAARRRYDAALCMLHDQALIPLKTLAFESGVNITLGLPVVRTSPDHGTAFDLAGSGRADPSSLIAALATAARLAATRAAARPEP